RLTTQLIDARTEAPLWSATYDRELKDVLTLQQELARAVATEIRVRMTAPERERLAGAGPVNPDAYREYLRGRAQWNRRTLDSLRLARAHFTRAIDLDPSYAAAHTALAQTYMLLGDDEFPGMEPVEALRATRSAANSALELDPDDAGAWAALAHVEYNIGWNWGEAGRYFERALVLAPGDANVHHWYAWYLMSLGRLDEALSTMAVARDLNPLSPIIVTDEGYPHLFAGRPDAAIRRFEAALEQDPNFVQAHIAIGRAHEVAGAYADARRRFERAVVLSERAVPSVTFLARSLAKLGDLKGARAIVEELRQRSRTEYVTPLAYAWIYTAMGEHDAALDWLERTAAARSTTMAFLLVVPELQTLAGHPRFEALVARLQTDRLAPRGTN
ncbi:MAG TPA: tetratricopeptide repeat protein, partial [Vicinamibacterales bacterium]